MVLPILGRRWNTIFCENSTFWIIPEFCIIAMRQMKLEGKSFKMMWGSFDKC
jgi:hypothetical protein